MKRKVLISVACMMALLLMTGCSGSEASGSAQQNNDPAAAIENTAEAVSEEIMETDAAEVSDPVTEGDA